MSESQTQEPPVDDKPTRTRKKATWWVASCSDSGEYRILHDLGHFPGMVEANQAARDQAGKLAGVTYVAVRFGASYIGEETTKVSEGSLDG